MNFWDSRFNSPEFAYGQAPNDFLVQSIQYIKPQARILSLGEGEGRNAIYLAKHGFQVDCVDMSQVGLNKLNQWAEKEGLSHLIKTFVGVLGEFEFPGEYDAIVSIWCHMPQEPRFRVHQQVTKHLKVGGVYILEAYTPSNIGRKTGGPQEPAMCMQSIEFKDLGLKPLVLLETERMIKEGQFHDGVSAVVQFVGKK